MGSTAKMVHQILVMVHIVADAKVFFLAKRTGLKVDQMLNIKKGAAGLI